MLTDTLRRRRVFILDNFEQLLSATMLVSGLLDTCADLRILVTSQSSPVPEKRTRVSAGAARHRVSRLGARRGRTVRPACRAAPQLLLTEANSDAVAEICKRLDGFHLLSSWPRQRPISRRRYLGVLNGHAGTTALHVLSGGARELPARHQTLRQAILELRILLPACGGFRFVGEFGGVAAAEAVWAER